MGEPGLIEIVRVRTALVRRLRTIGAAVAVVGAVAVLTSCSQAGLTPASPATATGAVVDPSIPSASPTEVVTPSESTPNESTPTGSTPTEGVPTAAAATVPAAAPAEARAAVVPFITTADWDAKAQALDVSAIVPTVREGGGTCTVTLTQGATTRTATSTGVAASTYTGCQAVAVTGLATGTWQVRVRYASDKAVGASAVRTVQVG